jgi:hypothetical protein
MVLSLARVADFLKRLTLKPALAVLGVVLALAAAEAGLRVAHISYPPPAAFIRYDRDLGWSHKPGAVSEWRYEGFSKVQINSAGLRDREHALAKPPGAFRVAVLGDSMTEALQVPQQSNSKATSARSWSAGCSTALAWTAARRKSSISA